MAGKALAAELNPQPDKRDSRNVATELVRQCRKCGEKRHHRQIKRRRKKPPPKPTPPSEHARRSNDQQYEFTKHASRKKESIWNSNLVAKNSNQQCKKQDCLSGYEKNTNAPDYPTPTVKLALMNFTVPLTPAVENDYRRPNQ
jgi:hypothetical protein